MNRKQSDFQMYWTNETTAYPEDDEMYLSQYFYDFYEPFLPPYRLMVELGVLMLRLRNSKPLRICKTRRLRVTYGKYIFESELTAGKRADVKAMLFKIKLQ